MTVAVTPIPSSQNRQLGSFNARLQEETRRSIRSTPFVQLHGTFGDAVGAALWRENWILSTYHELTDGDTQRPEDDVAGYNPYSRFKELFPKETHDKLRAAISDGELEEARSDAQLKAIVEDILYEQDLQDKMGKDWVGALAGSAIGAILDPTTYIPIVGLGAKVSAAGKAGLFALNTALQTTASEMVLQATQRERSLDETLMNIGVSGVIGGGLGLFAGALNPKFRLHPNHPENPLRKENLGREGEITRDLTGAIDNLSVEELDELRLIARSDLGAKDGSWTVPELARGEPGNPLTKFLRKGSDFFFSSTIKGQVLRSLSPRARAVGIRLFDPAGIIFKHSLRGEANPRAAVALKTSYNSEYEMLASSVTKRTNDLKAELGQKVDERDMWKLIQRHLLTGKVDDKTRAAVEPRYGSNFDKIDATARELAETIHQFNDVWEGRLTEFGLLQDVNAVAKLEAEVAALRTRIKAHDGVNKAELEQLRAERNIALKELRTEKQKPAPLGRRYGHAQLWNRDMIISRTNEFRAFLHDVLRLQPDEDWLLETYEITRAQLDDLPKEEARAIREAWSGDAHLWRIEKLEMDLAAAQDRAKQSQLDLMEVMRKHGTAKRDEVSISLSEARARRDALHARLAAARARKAALEQEQRSFTSAAQAARMAGDDRMARMERGDQTAFEVTRDRRVAGQQKASDRLDLTIEDVLTDPATPLDAAGNPRFMDAGDVAKATDANVEAVQKMQRAEQTVRTDKDNVRVPTARQQGRAQEASVGLGDAIREADELAAKTMELDAKLQEYEALHDAVTRARRDLTETVRVVKAERNIDAKTVKAVKRALSAAKGVTPLSEQIDQIVDQLVKAGTVPHGILDRILDNSDRTTGRVKARGLHLDDDQRIEALDRGWLRDDLSNILRVQTDQLASELSLREALEIGPGKRFESWQQVTEWVTDEYEDILAQTPADKLPQVKAERDRTLANLIEARDRLRGGTPYDDGTNSGWMRWAGDTLKRANVVRYSSGFTLSSMTDLATMFLRHPEVLPGLVRHFKQTVKIMRKAASEDPSHFQAIIQATEVSMGAHAAARRMGTENLFDGQIYGYGIGAGMTKKVTGAVDKTMEAMANFGTKIGGLAIWNSFFKTAAGLMMMDRLATLTRRALLPADHPKALTPLEVADMASFGIGLPEARRIAGFLDKYGRTTPDGRFDPHFEAWDGPDGIEAVRDMTLAIQRDMNRSINTPDVGDTPRLMTTQAGGLLLTFQTFAFTFQNQFMYPLAQRIGVFKDKTAMLSLGLLFGAATAVMVGKDIINGRDPSTRFSEENIGTTLYEVVDRSGLIGWLSPYADSALKLTSGFTGFSGGDRYVRNGFIESALGINYALLMDVQKAVAGMADPDADNRFEKLWAIAPFAMQSKLLGRLTGLYNPN